ncbi:MAG: glycosyltransferase [Paludibacter sp.]
MENSLVSIVVITFNSSEYVLETLESAKNQTYQNIELIVSDDCSTDNTVYICKKWLEQNNSRFIRTELVTVEKNTGVPANCNRGLKVAFGDWIKLIAGDDALFNDSIENMSNIAFNHPEIEILLTQVEVYENNFEQEFSKGILLSDWQSIFALDENTDSKIQIEYLLDGKYFPAPGFFIKRNLFTEIAGYDESNKYIEDVPFYLKLLFVNKKIYFRPIVTVKYRKHNNNITAFNNTILPIYMQEYCLTIVNASKRYGKMKYILNSHWNLFFVRLILILGNKGTLCNQINKFRLHFQTKRIFNFIELYISN